MKMHVLSGGRLRMKQRAFLPDADRESTMDVPVGCFLLRHPQGNVLFDTGCHPSVATDAAARWGGLARAFVPLMAPGDGVIGELARIGLAATDIDVVVNSHLHMDHCGCNAFFTRATVLVHVRELAAAREPAAEGNGYFRADWDHAMPVEAIDAQRDLFDDGRIVLLQAPGHTPGSMVALVGLDRSGSFLLAADAVALRANIERDIVPRNTWNAELWLESLAEIHRIEGNGATVICGHDPDQWQTLRTGVDAYD